MHKNQETNHNINVKVKFKTYFLLIISVIYNIGYILLIVILLGHGDIIQDW